MSDNKYLNDLKTRLSKLSPDELLNLLLTPGLLGSGLIDKLYLAWRQVDQDADLDRETEAVSK